MIVTEKEAESKWCPHGFLASEEGSGFTGSGNLYYSQTKGGLHPMAKCLGSRCMAWRWAVSPAEARERAEPPETATGFCGLAYSVRLP